MVDFVQYVADINSACSVEDAFSVLEKALLELGFDRVVYSLITDHPQLQQSRGHGILRNYPEDWMKYYFAKGYVDVDPVIKVIKQRPGYFLWNDLPEIKKGLAQDEHVLMEEAREAKLLEGIGLSLHGSCGQIVGMGIASSMGGTSMDKNSVSLVYALCSQFHVFYQEKETKVCMPIIQLSAREKEVLTWTAEGKSRTAIGDILQISDDTVKTYMNRIYQKLGVNSIQLAVIKAVMLGLIHPNIPHKYTPNC
ncbi:MAG TPA: LuxR family transcriptional regulator [Rickettsiales bacterium]|nr:LuxR family transcriptional regulator [Rickettsiales bacterium]